jgi:acyl carrier protein
MGGEIQDVIRGFLAAELGTRIDGVNETTDIRLLPEVDSLALLAVIAQVEDHYQVQFHDEEVFGVRNIEQLAEVTQRHLRVV